MTTNSWFSKHCLVTAFWVRLWNSSRLSQKSIKNNWTNDLTKLVANYCTTPLLWDLEFCGKSLTQDKIEPNIMTHSKGTGTGTIYCPQILTSGKHHWKIKILKFIPGKSC